ncbi:MAG: MoaD family protein [Clostridia bacterium]|nr:MoaD family protein [Clostridia bacterium]
MLGPLIKITGASTFTMDLVEGTTIWGLLEQAFEVYGEPMKAEVMNGAGTDLAPYYIILINGRNCMLMHYMDTPLKDGQVIHIMPPAAGG